MYTTQDVKNSNVENEDTLVNDLISWLRWYADHRINPYLYDARRCFPPYILLDFGVKGLFGMNIPHQFGGMDLKNSSMTRIIEQLGAIDLSLATLIVNNNFLGVRPLVKYANEPFKKNNLPLLSEGRKLISYALTEPSAGSNPLAMKGTGRRSGNDYILNATKMWIGSASWASHINTFVKLEGNSFAKQGITCFCVPADCEGLVMGEELMTMGMRGMVQNKIHYKNVRLDEHYLLGEIGEGMEVAHDAMMYTRLAFGAAFLGTMKRCAQLMHRYASRRTAVSTGRLLDNPVILSRFTEMLSEIDMQQAVVNVAADFLDKGITIPSEIYIICKTAGSEFLWKAADYTMQAMGGRGYLENNIITQIMRDARVGRIFEGPTETLISYVGGRFLRGDNRQELIRFISTSLNAPDVSEALENVFTDAKNYLKADAKAINHLNFISGSIVSWAILISALTRYNKDEQYSKSIEWGWIKMKDEILQLKNFKTLENVCLKNIQVEEKIGIIYNDIGNIETTLAGEDLLLDPLLQRSFAAV